MGAVGQTRLVTKPAKPGARSSGWTPDRPGRRGAAPALLSEVLVGTQEFIAQKTGALMSHEEWRRVVGPKVASRSRLGGLVRGTLTIKVASSAWSNELSFLRMDIIERLALAGHEVKALRFRVDPNPFNDQSAQAPREKVVVERRTLPAELEERLRQIEDPNLRGAIREAASWHLAGTSQTTGGRGSAGAGRPPRPRR